MTHSSELGSPKQPARDFFTVGSTKDEVLAAQGTPDKFADTMFEYGLSRVWFRDGRVETWDQSVLNPLKVKLATRQLDRQP